MEQVIKLLRESPALYLGTVTPAGRPHVRPVSLMLEREGRLYFCTSRQTSLFCDLTHCPYVEVSVMSPEYVWVRVAAQAVFTDDRAVRETALAEKPRLQALFGSADNPELAVFYLQKGTVTVQDYVGSPPRTVAIV